MQKVMEEGRGSVTYIETSNKKCKGELRDRKTVKVKINDF